MALLVVRMVGSCAPTMKERYLAQPHRLRHQQQLQATYQTPGVSFTVPVAPSVMNANLPPFGIVTRT